MGTTDYETVRTTQISLIEGLTPSLISSVRFRRHRAENDFRDWCVENTQAAFRRFSVLDMFDYEPVAITNSDVEFVEGTESVVIAYPNDFRYGRDNLRDLGDLMRKDFYQIEKSLGHNGTGNYTDSHAVLDSMLMEDHDGVSFLAMVFTFRFYRSV